MRDFKKYDIWQLSNLFTLEIYNTTNLFPKEEMYGITSQLRRASAWIPTNIAEGCGRASDAEFNHFLNIALGSALETEYLIILSKDLRYIDENIHTNLDLKINSIKSKIYSLKNKLKLQ